ncbi:MAG: hypothetical protein KF873_12150 [Gemmataceae bacterium]|nr:hypothetical protein [Gemmataceae bacterium]
MRCLVAETSPTVSHAEPVQTAIRFLTALFEPTDRVLIRPIETWTERGGKRSQVGYQQTRHWLADPEYLAPRLPHLFEEAATQRFNLFFVVCPRFAGGGQFDLAWQIRTVRVLWADLDGVTVEQARQRIVRDGLPEPTVLLGSGHGAHVYWRLDEPYRIDDVGDPPPVQIEWVRNGDGKNKPRHYFVEDGERVYLDSRKYVNRLSAKAERMQDILVGLSRAIGGDHTHDLARLLRIAGTLNRKDERNGVAPKPTELVICEPDRRYPLAQFERFVAAAPEAERSRQVAQMPLPQTRRLTPTKRDKLEERLAACAIAPAGGRSEADFALCCFAVRNGVDRTELWTRVQGVGKFAERGEDYFATTWANAELEVRNDLYEQVRKDAPPPLAPSCPIGEPLSSDAGVTSGEPCGGDDGPGPESARERPTIEIVPAVTPIAETLAQMTHHLLQSKECFTRADQLVRIRNDAVFPILSNAELAGLISELVELRFIDRNGGSFKPLPTSYGSTWLHNVRELTRLPAIALFTRNPVFTEDWRLATSGYDAASGIYCAGPAVEPRDDTAHLDALLADFCFRTPADRANYFGMLLTVVLMPRFIGSKPAVLFNGNQPGLGKSMLAQVLAILRDGHAVGTASYTTCDEEFEKRLGAMVRDGLTTLIVDNAKTGRAGARIESACLERSITDARLSFRLLRYSENIQAENSHIFAITANSAEVSRDLLTRSVVVNLHHDGDPTRRTFTIEDPEGYALEHRKAILGELVGLVNRWIDARRPHAAHRSRFNKKGWANIVGGILRHAGIDGFLANADEAAREHDPVRRDFAELVMLLTDHPQGTWTGSELASFAVEQGLFDDEFRNTTPRAQAIRMGILATRFVDEPFPIRGGRVATFQRGTDRNGTVYRIDMAAPDDGIPD